MMLSARERKDFSRALSIRKRSRRRNCREFGAVILDKYRQEPLRQKLTELVAQLEGPIVVDSIRDTRDID